MTKRERLEDLGELLRLAIRGAQDDQATLTDRQEKELEKLADILEMQDIQRAEELWEFYREG